MYIFDTNTFITIFEFIYKSRFPSFWTKFDQYIESGNIVSVREVLNEISNYHNKKAKTVVWANENKKIFLMPDDTEVEYVRQIMQHPRFKFIVSKQSQLEGKPVADPFLIAKAKAQKGIVVTEEHYAKDGVKIPNICEEFGVKCINFEKFMEDEGWKF